MGLFKRKKQVRSIIKEYYGGNAGYFLYNYAKNIYNIPEVRTAIDLFSNIFSSTPIYRERIDRVTHEIEYFNNDVLDVQPNPAQNASQFWQEVITQLMLNSNVFIEPIFDSATTRLKHLYVLPVSAFQFKFINDDVVQVVFLDKPGRQVYNLSELIYLNRFSALGGGSKNDLGLYEAVIQALASQALNVASPKKVRALLQGSNAKMSANLKDKDKTGVMDDVKVNFANNVNGIAYLDSQWEVTPINWQENDVNKDLMKIVIETVYNYFSITDNIVHGSASELEISQFIQYRIYPIARQIERELTSKLFTERERAVGNKISIDTFMLKLTTISSMTQLFNSGIRNGVLNQDECRKYMDLSPIPNGLGRGYRASADTVGLDIIDQYELGKFKIPDDKNKNKEVDDNGEGETK